MNNKTNVIGYFNPNEYPIQLSLAEFNMVLQLQPNTYVVDRSGRLVNDPVLDRFVGKGKLARASDQKQQVEITHLRPVNDGAATPAAHQHSVSQAQRFDTKDGRVVAVNAVNTAPQPQTPPPVSYNPVKGYSVEEAKRLRYIKPTRIVPEDFGADETAGAPRSGQEIPAIKYATDTVRGRKPAPLPAELVAPATPQQQAIIATLERAAGTNPDDPNVLSNVSRTVVESNVPFVPGLPKPVFGESPAPVRLTPPPIPTNPVPTAVVPLPAPVLVAEDTNEGLVAEEELGAPVATEVDLQEEARVDAARRLPPPALADAIACPLCKGKTFAAKGLFLRHVRRFHEGKEAELMAPHGGA